MPPGVNNTSIVMIPKLAHSVDFKDFCPINLCNVIYKIVSKCLVNRLRPLLSELISENESAFISGRVIFDNASIAFECMHFIDSVRNKYTLFCAYTLDLSKAYDCIDLVFLEKSYSSGVSPKLGLFDYGVHEIKYSVKFNAKLLE